MLVYIVKKVEIYDIRKVWR